VPLARSFGALKGNIEARVSGVTEVFARSHLKHNVRNELESDLRKLYELKPLLVASKYRLGPLGEFGIEVRRSVHGGQEY
jgi:hypothetical protein